MQPKEAVPRGKPASRFVGGGIVSEPKPSAAAGCAFLLGIVAFIVTGTALMSWSATELIACAVADEQKKAIEAGVGRWEIDPATGQRRFVYGVK